MESVLWYVLTSTRGGDNRLRLLLAADEEPRNANQFAADLGLDYKTVRHHLDVLVENDILEPLTEGYGARYHPTDRVRHHWETVEKIAEESDDSQI